MLLHNDFYAIATSSTEGDTYNFTVHINPVHHIFDGHFPGNPVTPGVVQMEMIKELLSIALDKKMSLESMGTCKFLSILNPNETPDVDVSIKTSLTEDGGTKVTAAINAGDTSTELSTPVSFFKMNGVYM